MLAKECAGDQRQSTPFYTWSAGRSESERVREKTRAVGASTRASEACLPASAPTLLPVVAVCE